MIDRFLTELAKSKNPDLYIAIIAAVSAKLATIFIQILVALVFLNQVMPI